MILIMITMILKMSRNQGQPIKVSYHPDKTCDYKHSDSGHIMVSACIVISQDHVIEGSCDFVSRSMSR